MTNWWKLQEWLNNKAIPVESPRWSSQSAIETMTFLAVAAKVKELDSEECCASLTEAGY